MKSTASKQAVAAFISPHGNVGERAPDMPLAAAAQTTDRDQACPIRAIVSSITAVARVLSKSEIKECKEAQQAMVKEFTGLKDAGTWDFSRVAKKRDVINNARRDNEKVHFGRIFCICSIKGSELPVGHKDRKYKGRFVYDGREGAVRDEYNAVAFLKTFAQHPPH